MTVVGYIISVFIRVIRVYDDRHIDTYANLLVPSLDETSDVARRCVQCSWLYREYNNNIVCVHTLANLNVL
jgi:hypothetical protein